MSTSLPTLWQHQDDGVTALRALFARGVRRCLYQLPTGGGKTRIMSYIAAAAAAKGSRTIILAHRRELISQASDELADVRHGIIQAGYPQHPERMVQIASVATLVNRLDKTTPPTFIMVDEAHHCPAASYRKIFAAYPDAKILGVTATPCRTDGRGLDDLFDDLVTGPQVKELVDLGYLKTPRVFAPDVIDVQGIKSRAGDYAKDALEEVVDKSTVTGCAVSSYRRYADGLPAIAFCVSIRHAQAVAAAFRDAGYAAAHIDGTLDSVTRKGLLDDLAHRRIQLLTTCDLISEGLNVPVVACGIMLRPTKSLGLWLQQAGRCLRAVPGMDSAIILDHAGNSLRHGHPIQDREWSLEGTRRKGKDKKKPELQVRQCPQCFAVHMSGRPVCPECGHKYPVAPDIRTPEAREGELTEISEEQARLAKKKEVGRARSFEQLLEIEHKRGYKPGWARIIYDMRSRRRSV